MGISLIRNDRLLLQAIIASLVLHVVVALIIPALSLFRGDGPAIETLSFMPVTHIVIETPHPAPRPPAAVAPRYARVVHAVRAQSTRPRATHVHQRNSVQRERKSAAQAPLIALEQPRGSAATQTTQTGAPAAPATPQPEQIASTQTRRDTGGYLPFGAQQPDPVLDPAVLKALGALGVRVTLTVVVGEDGHTKSVAFDPEIDTHVEDQIRSMLAGASWDPAVCGAGVACEGRATIKL